MQSTDASCSLRPPIVRRCRRGSRWRRRGRWRRRAVSPPFGSRIGSGVNGEVVLPSSVLSASEGGHVLSPLGVVDGGFGRMQRGPHLHRRPRVRLRVRLDVDATLHDSRRWHVCSGGQVPRRATIASDCEVALSVSDIMPGRLLLRCKLPPRSPGLGPLACKISPQLGCDLGLHCLVLRLRPRLVFGTLPVIGTVLLPVPLSQRIPGGHICSVCQHRRLLHWHRRCWCHRR